MLPEARISITLKVSGTKVSGVRVGSTRLVHASRLFAGRKPHEVAVLLPTVFSLCGTAQRQACIAAVEGAAACPPSPNHSKARQAAVLAETVSELGLGMLRDWPAQIGAPADLAAAKDLRVAMVAAVKGDASAVARGRMVLASLLGAAPETVLADVGAFRDWVARATTPAARLFATILDEGLAGFGATTFRPMPAGGPADMAERLAGDEDGSYVARPEGGYETGPLARRAAHPLLAGLMGEFGNGLLARLAARLVETESSLHELDRIVQDFGADAMPAAGLADGAGDGTGVGLIEAARGLLAHRVELEDGRVKRYQILAPTEWNFHPAGPLVHGLLGAHADAGLVRRAEFLAQALDPCVTCTVALE
ncbi:MAG: nickel-dependent hydrogenase large subunit [Solirubrobacterales bacterium]